MSLVLSSCGTAMDLLDRDPPRNDAFVQISATGVGPLDASTPYDAGAIGRLMPDYTTGSVLIGRETETMNAISLLRSGSGAKATTDGNQIQVLQIIGGADSKIHEIDGVSRHVTGPAGERPGMTLAQTNVDPATCRPGTTLWIGMVVCKSLGAENVWLLFSFGAEAPAGPGLPPRSVLDKGELQRIIWRPRS